MSRCTIILNPAVLALPFARPRRDEARWGLGVRQAFLASRGYMLRQRYRPGWVPAWFASGQHPTSAEDIWPLPVSMIASNLQV